jgi:hypothetical protein
MEMANAVAVPPKHGAAKFIKGIDRLAAFSQRHLSAFTRGGKNGNSQKAGGTMI